MAGLSGSLRGIVVSDDPARLDEVLGHPSLQGLRRWVLATRDAHSLYAQYGFKSLSAPERFMEMHDPDVYRR